VHWHRGAEEGLVGNRECLRDTGGGGSSWYSVQVLIGDSFEDKVTVLSSVFKYWVGSSFIGSTSSIGLSWSSSGFSTMGGSWYNSIEEYCRRWVLQGIGTGGGTDVRSKDG